MGRVQFKFLLENNDKEFMGYAICTDKKSFRIIYEKWVDSKPTKRHVKQAEWPNLGFSLSMTLEQARAIARSLNANLKISKLEERRNRLEVRREKDNLEKCAYLPDVYVLQFEKDIVDGKDLRIDHWESAKKVIRIVNLNTTDWYFLSHKFYSHFEKLGYSIDYSNRIRRLLNEWGRFLSRQKNSFWQDIPAPRGKFANRIREAYEKKTNGGRYRARLSMVKLQSAKSLLSKAEFNWLLISVAFGLRPEEINKSLKIDGRWGFKENSLFVYQYKLERVEPNAKRRWKKIDIKFPHQKEAIKAIMSGDFSPPSRRTLRTVFGEKTTYYSGRKEFFPFMKKHFDAYTVSAWLGHRSLETARRYYDDPADDNLFEEFPKAVNE